MIPARTSDGTTSINPPSCNTCAIIRAIEPKSSPEDIYVNIYIRNTTHTQTRGNDELRGNKVRYVEIIIFETNQTSDE
jgi:hypothetical protein